MSAFLEDVEEYLIGYPIKFLLISTNVLCFESVKVVITEKISKINTIIEMERVDDKLFEAIFTPNSHGDHTAKLLINNTTIDKFVVSFSVEKSDVDGYQLYGRGVSDKCLMFFPTCFEFCVSV